MRTVKCPKCSALYEAIPIEKARQAIAEENAKSALKSPPYTADMHTYLECFHCATPSSSFVDVPPQDCPPGCTLAQAVLPVPVQPSTTAAPDSTGAGPLPLSPPSPSEPKLAGVHYLVVPTEMIGHAKRHGAKFDASKRSFYVVGDVPSELFNLQPKAAPKAKPHVVAPICPKCACHMNLITNTRDGSWFYKCAQRFVPNCRGTVDYERHLESIGHETDSSALSAFERSRETKTEVVSRKSTPKAPLTMSHKIAIAEIGQLGLEKLGSAESFKSWAESPKLALGRICPIEAMRTLEGCEKVKSLLRTME